MLDHDLLLPVGFFMLAVEGIGRFPPWRLLNGHVDVMSTTRGLPEDSQRISYDPLRRLPPRTYF